MPKQLNRRDMLRNTALAGAAVWTGSTSLRAAAQSPNEQLDVAAIGCGGRGHADLRGVAAEPGVNIVALCDVDHGHSAQAFKDHPQARPYHDFRKLLDEMHKQIDAVVVGTPDHTHAPPGVMAMKLGKHCYCEKPLTHCVYEARVMAEVAKEKGLVTQMGTQIHAGDNYRRVVELVQSGAIGPVDEVHVWCGASYGGGERPKETPPVPESLQWDLWLGPAPYRPYHPVYAPFGWRGWWDFANGGLGDFFCHYVDLPFWALKLRHPTTVQAEGSQPVHPESCHRWMIARYEFPARGDLPPVKLTWYDGGKHPEFLKERNIPEWGSGVLFIGRRGMLLADYGNRVLLPEQRFQDFQPPEPTIPNSVGHHAEWVRSCKAGGPTTCNFDYSGALTEAALLGSVSYRTGEKLQWDAAKLAATNCPEAERLIRRPYRTGWTL
ncbi:MAG: Gfo/Idh/MocA family oxidoreductase [Pirellulales bacterium]|nr:Gfo/Idh/MocA family oxidoreductase [Pirellulales bacterium]